MAPHTVRLEEVLHHRCDFDNVHLYRKMSGIKELDLRVRQVFPERPEMGFCAARVRLITISRYSTVSPPVAPVGPITRNFFSDFI